MRKQKNHNPTVTTVSFILMAVIAGGCILTIAFVLGVPSQGTALRDYLGTLAVIATLAIASNQVMYSVMEIEAKHLSGIEGLGKAVTQCTAPFAAVTVAVVVSEQHSGWYLLGIVPLTAHGWASLIDFCRDSRKSRTSG